MSSCGGNCGSESGCNCGMNRTLSTLKYLIEQDSSFDILLDEANAKAKNKEEAQLLVTIKVLEQLGQYVSSRSRTQAIDDFDVPNSKEKGDKKRPTTEPILLSWGEKKPRVQNRRPSLADMPIDLKKIVMELRGRNVKMVIKKDLTITDLDGNAKRFLMPPKKASVEFLTEEEKENIVQKKEDGLHFEGMEVSLIEPSLKESSIWLKKWKVGKEMSYVLSLPWISVATRNGLAVGDVIKLWSFRVDGRLYLALNKL